MKKNKIIIVFIIIIIIISVVVIINCNAATAERYVYGTYILYIKGHDSHGCVANGHIRNYYNVIIIIIIIIPRHIIYYNIAYVDGHIYL
jgi:hypothetical protein